MAQTIKVKDRCTLEWEYLSLAVPDTVRDFSTGLSANYRRSANVVALILADASSVYN